jgi:protoheme IX farnesyltransferase
VAALLYAGSNISWGITWPVLGIFLLASGASALNQYQEWATDEKMERTRSRPLPMRHITSEQAKNAATLLLVGGYLVFIVHGDWIPFLLGLFNVIWYNGVYTLLKRKTAFAVLPGALTGAVPVMMGWTAAGGNILDHTPLFLAFFIFLWQMPHFWLIMMKYGNEYKQAGLPVLTDLLNTIQMKRIIFAWILAASASAVLLIYFGIIRIPAFRFTLLGINTLSVGILFIQLFLVKETRYRVLFITGNLMMLAILVIALVDRLV